MTDNAYLTASESDRREALLKDHPLLPYQQFFLDYQLYSPEKRIMNITLSCQIPADSVDVTALKEAVDRVFHHYAILGTVFTFNSSQNLVQRYRPELIPDIDIIHTTQEAYTSHLRNDFVQPYRLIDSLLWRHQILVTEESVYLMVDLHHSIADKCTCMQLFRQIFHFMSHREMGVDNYYLYLSRYEQKMKTEAAAQDLRELGKLYGGSHCGFPKPDFDSRKNSNARRLLQTDHTLSSYKRAAKNHQISFGMALSTAGLMALSRYDHEKKVQVEWLYHGRNTTWKKDLVGIMLSSVPVAMDFNLLTTPEAILQEARRQYQLGRRYFEYSYGLHGASPTVHENMRICYLPGNDNPGNLPEGSEMEVYVDQLDGMLGLVQILVTESDENSPLTLISPYQGTRYRPESIDRLLGLFLDALNELLLNE